MTNLFPNRKIGSLCSKITDGAHHSPKGHTEGYPMFSVKDMEENGFSYDNVKLISEEDYQKLIKGGCRPEMDDVLIAKDGSYLKYVFRVKETKEEVILSSIAILRPDKNKVVPSYLQHVLRAPYLRKHMSNFVTGSALPRIILADFKKVEIPLPDKETQLRISRVLDSYDDLIDVNKRRISILEQLVEEQYKEWFVRKRFPGWEKTKNEQGIPFNWTIKRFDEFVTLKRGHDLPNDKMKDGKYPVVASTSIKGFHNEFKAEPPIVVTGRSGTLGTVQYIETRAWPLNTSLYSKDFHQNSPRYVYFVLKGLKLENFNSGAGVPTLNRNHLASLKLIVPPIALQNQFEESARPIYNEIRVLESTNENLVKTKGLLLPRLISGQLSIRHVKTPIQQVL